MGILKFTMILSLFKLEEGPRKSEPRELKMQFFWRVKQLAWCNISSLGSRMINRYCAYHGPWTTQAKAAAKWLSVSQNRTPLMMRFIVFPSPAVEKFSSSSSCSDEPVAVGVTPDEDTTLFVLPYEQVTFRAQYMSQEERFVLLFPWTSPKYQTEQRITVFWVAGPAFVGFSVSEVAVVGPPNLLRAGFQTVESLTMMTMAWVRSPNNLTRLLPICFAGNTNRCGQTYTNQLNRVIV